MRIDLFTRLALVVIAVLLAIHLIREVKPAVANAQSPLKVLTVEDYRSGPILGFSCVTNGRGTGCVVLTR